MVSRADRSSSESGEIARKCVAIFGGKGGGEVVAEYVAATSSVDRVLGFLNDEVAAGAEIAGYNVLGAFRDWATLPDDVVFNAPIHKVKENHERSSIIVELGIPENRWTSILHPMCSIARSAVIGRGVSIGAFTEIQGSAIIGRHVAIRSGVCLGHDSAVDDFAFIAAGVSIGGYSSIGRGAFIGLNAAIRERTTIGAFAVVGMGACVTRDVGEFEIVSGSPARRVGSVPRLGLHT